jgi:hypothetical protein
MVSRAKKSALLWGRGCVRVRVSARATMGQSEPRGTANVSDAQDRCGAGAACDETYATALPSHLASLAVSAGGARGRRASAPFAFASRIRAEGLFPKVFSFGKSE